MRKSELQTAQIEEIKKLSDSQIIDLIIETRKIEKDYIKRLKTVEKIIEELKEKIKIAENVKIMREYGVGEQLSF
jgi:nucleoid DNA-binding protein